MTITVDDSANEGKKGVEKRLRRGWESAAGPGPEGVTKRIQ